MDYFIGSIVHRIKENKDFLVYKKENDKYIAESKDGDNIKFNLLQLDNMIIDKVVKLR